MDDPIKCAQCSAEIEFWQDKCPVCGHPVSCPNIRKALGERDDLNNFYDAAIASSQARNTYTKIIILEHYGNVAKIVINMSMDIVYNMIRDPIRNYASYYRTVDGGIRKAAKEQHHVDRGVADAVLFPKYFAHMVYGALSCDGHGVMNYGPVAVSLKDEVAPLRASLLIENSFLFLATHYRYRQPLPKGYRAVWQDRGHLTVVKLASIVSAAMSDSDISRLILRPGVDRDKDDFVEVHIYDGFDKRAVEYIRLDKVPTHPHDQTRWHELKELLAADNINFSETGASP